MRISYRWVKEYISFPVSPREMMERLVEIGHEIEETIDLGLLEQPIRIARIAKVEAHPDPEATKLTVCTVDDGSGDPLQIVCGAPNVQEGAIGVLARAGAKLPNGLVLRKTKVRGCPSAGMLLAPDEMGLGSDHSGILLLDSDAPVGEGYDLILDVSITPNRPDCLNVVGLARDLAASYGQKVYPRVERFRETYENVNQVIQISVKCPTECPRYTARVIRGVSIGPSPDWLQRKLLAAGLRPINNVVDVTNYVLLDRGHPLHAFDYDKIRKREIIVRLAAQDETMKLLDGTDLPLVPGEDMVIADAEAPVALAGVMGGLDSQVTFETKDILLESAYFKPAAIRRTSSRHRLSTDASYRFERGADPLALLDSLDMAAGLIARVSGATVCKGVIDTNPRPPSPRTILLRPDRACRVLGAEISKTAIADILAALGFEIMRSDRENIVLSVPSYRVDVGREEDIYEEIARLHGFGKIPATLPYLPANATPPQPSIRMKRAVQDRLVALGFNETIHLSFIGPDQLDVLGLPPDATLSVVNPLSREQSLLRPDLVPSMIETILHNQNRGNASLRLFEVGNTFHFGDMATPSIEKEVLALAAIGGGCATWRGEAPEADFFDLKGVIEKLLAGVGVPEPRWIPGGPKFLHAGRAARIQVGDTTIGWLGEIAPPLREQLGLRGRLILAEIEMECLMAEAAETRLFREIPRFPAVERDLALVVARDIPAERIATEIRAAAGDLLESLSLFDHYTGSQVAEDKKSLGYRAVYRHPERTLTDAEVDEAQRRVVAHLGKLLAATLRL